MLHLLYFILMPTGQYIARIYYSLCLQTFHGKESHRLLQAGSRAARGQITVSGLPNRLNYCVIFIVHTQFKNMAAGRIIQAGGPRGGDPYVIDFITSCSFSCNYKAGALGV
jgi:hypothetical protein